MPACSFNASTAGAKVRVNASVSRVLAHYGQQYLDMHGPRMTAQQKKVLRAVMACRTDQLGTVSYVCTSCGEKHRLPRPCANRHCPKCQNQRTDAWLRRQLDRLLPCQYFLITFTVPQEVRAVLLRNPAEGYAALFAAAAASLKTLASNPRHLGAGQTGFFAVLHTHGRDLSYHPHVHLVVAGGAVIQDGEAWRSSRVDYYVPEVPLAIVFRAKLRDALAAANLIEQVPADIWHRKWVVDAEAIGDGESCLRYLAPYVFHGPVADWRVTACDWHPSLDEATLTLQVRRSGTHHYRPMRLTLTEFIRRWLQHVLPAGLQRVRYYGFLHPHSKYSLPLVRWLIAIATDRLYELACTVVEVKPPSSRLVCPTCGGWMVCLGYTPPPHHPLPRNRAPP